MPAGELAGAGAPAHSLLDRFGADGAVAPFPPGAIPETADRFGRGRGVRE